MAVSEREITAWGTWMKAAGRPQTTIELRTYHVRRTMREVDADPWSVTTEQLVVWLASKEWKPNTRRAYRASLRSFYQWAQATGRRRDNPAALIPTVRIPRPLPRATPETVYRAAVHDATPQVRLMIHLAAICGLRRGEIARTRREDVDTTPGGFAIRVVGKGGHVRHVPLPAELAGEITRMPAGWLFPNRQRGGHWTPAHIGVLVSRALPEGWTCHTLRHRCATVAYWGTRDIRAVQQLLGHAKLDTTMVYTTVRDDDVRALIDVTAA